MLTIRQSTPDSRPPPLGPLAASLQYLLWRVVPMEVITGSSRVEVGTEAGQSSGRHSKVGPSGAWREVGASDVQPMSFSEALVAPSSLPVLPCPCGESGPW